jgi:aminotransferase
LAFWCNKYNLLVYFDESFAADRYDTPRSRFAILPHLRDRTLSAMSCTPRYGLTAAKVGWLAGCDSLIRACRVTQGLQANHPSLLAQQIALSQLQQEVEPTRFRDRIEYTLQRLESMGLEPIRPSAGYFIWCSVKPWGRPAREIARQLLVEQRVVVQPGDLFGPGGSDYLRLSVGIDEGRLREGLERFGQSGIGNRESGKPLAVSHTEF